MVPVIHKLKKKLVSLFFDDMRSSFAQSGEDIIIADLFTRLGIAKPTYLDIGANHPVALSNTYRLYKKGSSGVCIEPNPVLYKKILSKRSSDICINAGVAFDERREADYYVFSAGAHGFNTFSKTEADFWEHTGTESLGKFKVDRIVKTQLIDVNEVIEKYFRPHPNLISIDVEGLDLAIIKTIDFDKYKPEVFCVETLGYSAADKETKNYDVVNFFIDKGYFVYADTYINTIFCLRDAYKNLA